MTSFGFRKSLTRTHLFSYVRIMWVHKQQPQYFVTTNQSEKLKPFIPFQTKNVFFIEIIGLDLFLT